MLLELSASPARVAAVLHGAASVVKRSGWDCYAAPVIAAIDRAARFVPGRSADLLAEAATVQAWDALCVQLGDAWPGDWEREPERTKADVLWALRRAADRLDRAVAS